MRLSWITAIAMLTACGGGDAYKEGGDDSGYFDDSGLGDSDTGDTGDTAPTAVATWWTLEGTLTVDKGDLDPDTTPTLQLEYWAEDPDVIDPVACTTSVPVTGATTLAELPVDVPVQSWWELTLGASESDPCGWEIGAGAPTTMRIGIGGMDSKLYPAMEANGYDPETASLYALYIQTATEGPVYVYGLAGTQAQYDGDATAATDVPVPDGAYVLEALHLLPL